jgi:hypothetical protein
MNPTMTLAAIRAAGLSDHGWRKLLSGLGHTESEYDPNRVVSLGDVATTNDAGDAFWCIRFLDWSDIAVRRAVIAGALMPTVRRASVYASDPRVAQIVAALDRWCAGDESVDLHTAALEAAVASALTTIWAAKTVALAAALAAARAAEAAEAAAEAATWATVAVAREGAIAAAMTGQSAWAAARAAEDAEREQQRADIIAAFPPVAIAGETAT